MQIARGPRRSNAWRGEIGVAEYERAQRKAAEARDRMIQANLRLVISVAKNFRNRGLPMEDLVNEGNRRADERGRSLRPGRRVAPSVPTPATGSTRPSGGRCRMPSK